MGLRLSGRARLRHTCTGPAPAAAAADGRSRAARPAGSAPAAADCCGDRGSVANPARATAYLACFKAPAQLKAGSSHAAADLRSAAKWAHGRPIARSRPGPLGSRSQAGGRRRARGAGPREAGAAALSPCAAEHRLPFAHAAAPGAACCCHGGRRGFRVGTRRRSDPGHHVGRGPGLHTQADAVTGRPVGRVGHSHPVSQDRVWRAGPQGVDGRCGASERRHCADAAPVSDGAEPVNIELGRRRGASECWRRDSERRCAPVGMETEARPVSSDQGR